jgi:hypothetical protein
MTLDNIGIVSDLHCGSKCGLLPPSYWNDYTPDAIKWLWSCWLNLIDVWPKLDLLIINGDPIDGKQHRSAGTGLIDNDLSGQTRIAIECLEPLTAKSSKIVRMSGTAYHESFDGPLAALDEHFGISKPPTMQKGIVRDIELEDGAILNVKHQPEGEGCLYRGTNMDRELMWAAITEARKHLPNATHIVRSHLHSDGFMRGFGKEFISTPCWCLQAPYALHKRRYRWVPDIGGVLMRRDPCGYKGYTTSTKTYPIPAEGADNYAEL